MDHWGALQLGFVLLSGLCFGSFATLASHRLPQGEDIVRKPSRCPQCSTTLKIPDLFPVFSWLAARGRCRHCKAAIHWRYPVIELVTMAAFADIYFAHGFSLAALLLMGMATMLMIMIVADFEHYIIPDLVHVMLLPLGIAYGLAVGRSGADMAGGFFLGLGLGLTLCYGYRYLRNKEGLGLGDVKFLAVAGLWLGLLGMVPFLFLSGVAGVLTALIWRLLGRGAYFPFGPALAISLYFCIVHRAATDWFWLFGIWIRRTMI